MDLDRLIGRFWRKADEPEIFLEFDSERQIQAIGKVVAPDRKDQLENLPVGEMFLQCVNIGVRY